MTEMEKQLLSALESLQASYEKQHQAWQESYSSLQHMFETTSQALNRSDMACQHLSNQVNSLRGQVELERQCQPVNALVKQHEHEMRLEKQRARYHGPSL